MEGRKEKEAIDRKVESRVPQILTLGVNLFHLAQVHQEHSEVCVLVGCLTSH